MLASPAMRIPHSLYDEMVAHAQADAPNECCGVIGTRDGTAVRLYKAVNIEASKLKYNIGPDELYRIYNSLEEEQLDLGIIYHSHTRSDPYPSQTDINLAGYPDALYVIVGLAGAEPEVKAYEIRDRQVIDAELTIS
jgi:[CysO sulfur-carrier protein]-S-L-cysteine hydrolase